MENRFYVIYRRGECSRESHASTGFEEFGTRDQAEQFIEDTLAKGGEVEITLIFGEWLKEEHRR